ncbi:MULTISPECIES: hypothetical protein [unclassified Oceanispirochaeta]|uniref:hypothetical protein n=1 Tax=unclassified Oceanispirochaeta TaxID=2635722 RepID=UPI000E099286|nr:MULTISPECIES: hypothetical protein [unclassified Oceanispirochaeta]MBF9018864.1 hypothetical protein [Oceanispirochaeta sp. M2]NPD75352.1 hypothetical protein [Oceanispirochaeta sp. M1]RDG28802.1 hypothetical protein DV872_24975 [Oceanispirochaeta sp. M1]
MENLSIRKTSPFYSILLCLIFLSNPLQALNTQLGIRGFLSGGYPSGKGLWDWTDTHSTGTLEWGIGGGGGLVSRLQLNDRFYLEGGINYVYIRAGQTLDVTSYTFTQMSIEFPLIFKSRLPFEKSEWYLGAGPNLIILPFEALRNNRTATPDKSIMMALQVGLDYKVMEKEKSDILLSANFIHPVTSPAYEWEEESSGSVRINRLELCVTWLLNIGRREL